MEIWQGSNSAQLVCCHRWWTKLFLFQPTCMHGNKISKQMIDQNQGWSMYACVMTDMHGAWRLHENMFEDPETIKWKPSYCIWSKKLGYTPYIYIYMLYPICHPWYVSIIYKSIWSVQISAIPRVIVVTSSLLRLLTRGMRRSEACPRTARF